MAGPSWRAFSLAEEMETRRAKGKPYREFLRQPSLSCGIYFLKAGANDLQAPHDEDEVYHVLEGRARIRIEDEEKVVGPGTILYVPASAEHSFCEIEEDLTLLVFFASGGPTP